MSMRISTRTIEPVDIASCGNTAIFDCRFCLASQGREDAVLYTGSWSDWCSYL